MTYPDRIRKWVEQRYNPKYVERIVDELLDAASEGPRTPYHTNALAEIFPELNRELARQEIEQATK